MSTITNVTPTQFNMNGKIYEREISKPIPRAPAVPVSEEYIAEPGSIPGPYILLAGMCILVAILCFTSGAMIPLGILCIFCAWAIIVGGTMHTIDNVRLQNNNEKYQRNIWDLHTEQTKFFLENAKQRLPEVQTLVRDLHIALPTGMESNEERYLSIKDKYAELTAAVNDLKHRKAHIEKNQQLTYQECRESCKAFSAKVDALLRQINDLETKIGDATGGLTLPLEQCLAGKGLNDNHFATYFERKAKNPFGIICRKLQERGVKNLYDLKDKKILIDEADTTRLIKRIIDFINENRPVKQT